MTRIRRTSLFPDCLHTTPRRERNKAVKLLPLFEVETYNRAFKIGENAVPGNDFKSFTNALNIRFWSIAKIDGVLDKTTHKNISFSIRFQRRGNADGTSIAEGTEKIKKEA